MIQYDTKIPIARLLRECNLSQSVIKDKLFNFICERHDNTHLPIFNSKLFSDHQEDTILPEERGNRPTRIFPKRF